MAMAVEMVSAIGPSVETKSMVVGCSIAGCDATSDFNFVTCQLCHAVLCTYHSVTCGDPDCSIVLCATCAIPKKHCLYCGLPLCNNSVGTCCSNCEEIASPGRIKEHCSFCGDEICDDWLADDNNGHYDIGFVFCMKCTNEYSL
jgi:hypothetical protein